MAHDGEGKVRYKVNGQFVYLPRRTKAEQIDFRKEYMKAWCQSNPEKVDANIKRHKAHNEKVMSEYSRK